MPRFEKQESDLQENVVFINRVAKVVKGGRRFSFAAVVVVGDGKGRVGAGLGKAAEVPEAIRKGVEDAKKNMINVALKNGTIPHESLGIYGAGKVIMRPAAEGTGIKAGGSCSACAGRRSQCSHQIPWFFQSDQYGKGYLGRNGKIGKRSDRSGTPRQNG